MGCNVDGEIDNRKKDVPGMIKHKVFEYQNCNGLLWVRFFGYGFYLKNINKKPLSFSERNGIKKTFKVFGYLIGTLYP